MKKISKPAKTTESVEIDATQLGRLMYMSIVTNQPLQEILFEVLDEWLDVNYADRVWDAENGEVKSPFPTVDCKSRNESLAHTMYAIKALVEVNPRRVEKLLGEELFVKLLTFFAASKIPMLTKAKGAAA